MIEEGKALLKVMEDWQKEFWTILETVSVEVEQFLEDISNNVEEVAQQVQ